MRAIHFTKIDFLSTKQQLKAFPFIAALFGLICVWQSKTSGNESGVMGIMVYVIFLAITFSGTPFGACRSIDARFLMILPADATSRVAGRFLYGLSLLGMAAACAAVIGAVGCAFGIGFSAAHAAIWLLGLEIGVMLVTLEYTFLYLFGEAQGPYMLNIVRVVPAMIFFFTGYNLAGELTRETGGALLLSGEVVRILYRAGACGAVLAAALVCGAIRLCARVMRGRDY